MAQYTKKFVQDLQKDIKIRQCGSIAFNADDLSNIITVELYDGGNPAVVSGTVVGAVVCSDGTTVPITNGTISGNRVSITLTAACFAVLGAIGVGIQLITGGVKTTILKAIYNVLPFETDTVIDPDSRITLNISDLIEAIEDAVASIPPDYSALTAEVAEIHKDLGQDFTLKVNQTVTAASTTAFDAVVLKGSKCRFTNNSSNAAMVLYLSKDGTPTTITPDGVAVGRTFEFEAADDYDGISVYANNTNLAFEFTAKQVGQLLGQAAPAIVDTASGAVATFTDGADDIPMRSVKAYFNPVQSGSGNPSPQNIRPLSGWTAAVISVRAVNVWDEAWEVGGIDWTTGLNNDNETDRIRGKNYIHVMPNTTYYFANTEYSRYVWCFDENKTLITGVSGDNNFIQLANGNGEFTTPANCYYIRFDVWTAYGTTYNHDLSINYPATDTSYHAAAGNTYTVTWQTEAGTVYVGYVDLVNGVLTVTHGIVDMGTQDWGGEEVSGHYRFYAAVQGLKPSPTADAEGYGSGLICDRLVNVGNPITDNAVNNAIARYSNSNAVYVRCDDYATVEAFTAGMSGAQLVYELETPQTYQLTAQQVKTILGTNNIWANTGNVTVTYCADTKLYIQKAITAALAEV